MTWSAPLLKSATAKIDGDVEAVGPLHGTHEPQFYICGFHPWVAGYMEGAVRTGRAAARAALREGGSAWTSH